MEQIEKHQKNIKLRLRVMLIFILIAYLPFMTVLGLRFDAVGTSLSGIGWKHNGLGFLFLYVAFTVPLMIYQVYLFLTLSDKKSKGLMTLSLLGGLMMALGTVFPIKETSPQISHLLHVSLCQIGSVLSIIAVTLMVVMYCKNNKQSVKKVGILYAQLLTVVIVSFGFLFTAALFEVGTSLLFLIAMYMLNSATHKSQIEQKEIVTDNMAEIIGVAEVA